MPLSSAEENAVHRIGFKNTKPLDASSFPLLHQKLLQFSQKLGVEPPKLYVSDYVGPPDIERLNLSLPFVNLAQIGNNIVISRSSFTELTQPEIAAFLGHEMVHLHENHTGVRMAAGLVAGIVASSVATKLTHPEKKSSRRSFLLKTAGVVVPLASFAGVGSLTMREAIYCTESRADLVSAELFDTGSDLISALKKVDSLDQKIRVEYAKHNFVYSSSLTERYWNFLEH